MLSLKYPFFALLFTLALLFVEICNGEIVFRKGSPQVTLASDAVARGVLKFSRNGRPFSAFTGIPFATVPDRFAEPQLLVKPQWNGVKDFVEAGPMCPQLVFVPGQTINDDEDCLNLNVYVPMNNTESKKGYPVMVWIHGGGFVAGGGYGYLPTYFADEDVVLVTINYRVGVFGFLSTGDEVVPGNNGLKDQVMALKWVKDNIAKFSGNPDKVTIFGESAGGASVHYLMLSPTAKGLFHRAIQQSGSAISPWSYQANPKQMAMDLAANLNCPPTTSSQEIVKCLKGVSKHQLNVAQNTFKSAWLPGLIVLPFGPTAEPEASPTSTHTPFLTKSPIDLLTGSEEKNSPSVEVPWMVGACEHEGSLMVGLILSDEKFVQEMDANWGDRALKTLLLERFVSTNEEGAQVAEKIKKFYFGDKAVSLETGANLVDFGSDAFILNGVYKSVKETVSRGKNKAPVYLYQYTYNGPISIGSLFFKFRDEEQKKTGHADELQHLFDLDDTAFVGASGAVKEDTPDAEFSRHFVRLWASFAKHGEPKHSWGNSPSRKWKPVSKKNIDNIPWYRIDSNPTILENDPYKERMQFWDELWRDHFLAATSKKGTNMNEKSEL